MQVNCVLLLIYTFILHLYVIFMPFYSNDHTARVTHFSSTLFFRLDILPTDFFHFLLFNHALAKKSTCSNKRIFCSIHPGDIRSNSQYTILWLPLCCTAAKVRLCPLIGYTVWRPHCLQRGSRC